MQSTYDCSKKNSVLSTEHVSRYQKRAYKPQQNIVVRGPQDVEGTNMLVNEKDNFVILSKTYTDEKHVTEIIKANNEIFVLKYEGEDTEYHEPICNNLAPVKNIFSNDLQSEENIDAINISVNGENHSAATLEPYTDKKEVLEIIKANNEVFGLNYEEDIQYQEPIHNNVTLQRRKKSQIEEIIDNSNILANEKHYTVNFEKDDNKEGFLFEIDEDIEISENHFQKVKPNDSQDHKPPDNNNRSLKRRSGSKKKPLICPICSIQLRNKLCLKSHIFAIHEKQRPFTCSYCPKTFARNRTRQIHELIHSGEYPFVCKWCQKGFRVLFTYKVHIEIHTTLPELLCRICKRAQKSKEELENHLKAHEEKRLYSCSPCRKKFSTLGSLKRHQHVYHLNL